MKKKSDLKAVLSILLSVVIIAGVFLGVVSNLLDTPNEVVHEVGAKTFRMFTVLSNMLMAVVAALSIPFAVDGIRYRNYHLPRWIVACLYSGTVCVSLTFVVALSLLSSQIGFHRMMLYGSNFYLHTLIPICAIGLFVFINDFHHVPLRVTVFAGIPVLTYAVVYIVSSVLIGEDQGGWRDHYRVQEYMPWYLAVIMVAVITVVLAVGLRLAHNAVHKRDKTLAEHYYQSAQRYSRPTIEEALAELAREQREYDKGGDLIVPRRVIRFLENKYQSGRALSELCGIYVAAYLGQSEETERNTIP